MAQVDVTNIQGYALTDPVDQAEVTNVQGYALLKMPSQLSLRSLGGYAMASKPSQLGLRVVGGYVMAGVPTPLPAGVTGQQAVLNMIAAKAKTSRPASDFTIDHANILDGDQFFNSTVKAYASAQSGLAGSMTFRYNRVPLSRMGLLSTGFEIGAATTIYGLLSTISAAAGITLTTDDVEDGPILSMDETVTLRAKSTSWWFLPDSTLVIGKPLTSISVPISSDTIDW